MSSSDDAETLFRRLFVDRDATNLIDKVDFSGIIGSGLRSIVLVFFLALVGLAQAAGQAVTNLLDAIMSMIRLAVSAPTLTLAEIQQEASAIAAREILDFGLFALPVSAIAALAAVGAVAFFFQVFWRP